MQRVKIVSTSGVVLGTRITDSETGAEVHGVTGLTIDMPNAGAVVTATLRVALVEVDVEAEPRFVVLDPRSGEPRPFARIVFADGDEFVP
jgi:hypothetical protein